MRIPFILALLALAACSGSPSDTADTESSDLASGTYTNPLLGTGGSSYSQCPDPNVHRFGANYFMVCTSDAGGPANAFPIHWSPDLVHWHFIAYVFSPSSHPRWAKAPGSGADYWAPELERIGDTWVVTFAATSNDPSKGGSMAIGVATADAIAGPWTSTSEPLVSQGDGSIAGGGDGESGRIDATLLRDPSTGALYHDPATGNLFLYYIYQPRWIHVTELAPDALSVVRGSDHELTLSAASGGGPFTSTLSWEQDHKGDKVVEGVEAHSVGGAVYLLYSGGGTWDGTYAVGVARADSPLGPFTKHSAPILRTSPSGSLVGPGHSSQWIYGPNGHAFLLFHTQRRSDMGANGPRLLNLEEVTFDTDGWPAVGDGYPTQKALALP